MPHLPFLGWHSKSVGRNDFCFSTGSGHNRTSHWDQCLSGWIHGIRRSRIGSYGQVSHGISSTFGRGWTPRSTFSLRGFKSTQIRTLPLFFGMTTIPAHHGVGSSTFEMTLMDFVLVRPPLMIEVVVPHGEV